MTPITTCLLIIGLFALMQAADDWGVWVRLEKLYNKKTSDNNL